MRIYATADGRRVLGLINPIKNESQCSESGCHTNPDERTVLGVLDVRLSLERIDADIASAQKRSIAVAIAAVLLTAILTVLFLSRTVVRPVRKLIEGTQEISSGNLDHAILIHTKDEIGRLADSFNAMTSSRRYPSLLKVTPLPFNSSRSGG